MASQGNEINPRVKNRLRKPQRNLQENQAKSPKRDLGNQRSQRDLNMGGRYISINVTSS
jgi:hypothetical protein